MYLNRITVIGFLGSEPEKKVSTQRILPCFRRHENVVEE
jgi:hypothetical protein